MSDFMELHPSAQSSFQKEYFVNTSKRLLENRNWIFPVVRYLTWKLEFFSIIFSVLVVSIKVVPLKNGYLWIKWMVFCISAVFTEKIWRIY